MKALKLAINMWYDCNQKCKHCYIQQAPDQYTKELMDDGTKTLLVKACKDWYMANGPKVYSSAYFLGGEPMLRPEKVLSLMRDLRTAVPTIDLRVCTNGSILRDEDLENFKELNTEFQVSVNELSLDEFDRRMAKIAAHGISQRPLITLTAENLERLSEIMNLVYKYTQDCMWHQEFVGSGSCMWHQEFGKDDLGYIKLYREALVQTLKQMLTEGKVINPDLMWEHFHVGWTEKTGFDHVCARHADIVDPDGAISWCLVNKHSDGMIIGNLHDEGFAFDKVMKVQSHPDWKVDVACAACAARFVCGLGCPYQKLYVGPNREAMCEVRREIVPLLLEMNTKWQSMHR